MAPANFLISAFRFIIVFSQAEGCIPEKYPNADYLANYARFSCWHC